MSIQPPKCKCYNAGSYLPWPALEDLSLLTNEYNSDLIINRPNYRLLENDLRLQFNPVIDPSYDLFITVIDVDSVHNLYKFRV